MSNTIEINSNMKKFDIVDLDGKVLTTIYFNPTDINILHRYEETMRSLATIKLKFGKVSKNTDIGKLLKEVDAIVYEKVDYLLNAQAAEKIFSVMGPFSLLEDGDFYVEVVLKAIGQTIKNENAEYAKKLEEKVNKHTAKYYG